MIGPLEVYMITMILVVVVFFLLVTTMLQQIRIGRLEKRTRALIDPDEWDGMLEDLHNERMERETQWRADRGIPDVPSHLAEFLQKDPPLQHVAVSIEPTRENGGAIDPLDELMSRKDPYRG